MQEEKPAFEGKPFPVGMWNLAIATLLLLTVRMGRKDLPPATPNRAAPSASLQGPSLVWPGTRQDLLLPTGSDTKLNQALKFSEASHLPLRDKVSQAVFLR